ncbi:Multiple C2 and transmembrane domain-containing protein 2 [Nibea albiflora]|uniref:Multiple C2 and transmembrane domain-containing protein 2 n=1 Tax=Nibea albiflora TaxID=240163 RepID=A0ACB7FEH0_NIBAL|nr:Multiple C2 and transmembrane domain-containing protein 2 [Nibea albiflora]
MDVKKKNFLENIRMKTKFAVLKKPRKKPLDKQGRNLAHRRSISVPDLRFVPGEAENSLPSTTSEGIFFGISPGLSDTDSIASGCTTDGPLFMDKLNDSFPEPTLRPPTDHTNAALYRQSAPVETLLLYEEIEDMRERKVNMTQEALYAQVDKKAKGNVPRFTFDPIPAPRSVFTNPERECLRGEDIPVNRVLPGMTSASVARASSLGEQVSPYIERRTASFEKIRPASEKGTPPSSKRGPANKVSLMLEPLGTPLESADGTSLDSACGTPSEERLMPWTTDSEEQDREPCSPLFTRSFCSEEALLEQAQYGEALEEMEMSSEPCDFFEEHLMDPLENSVSTPCTAVPMEVSRASGMRQPINVNGSPQQGVTAGPEVQVPVAIQRYLLNINLKQGRNLVIRDKRSGTSDPYVKFKLEGKQIYKSKVVYKSLNPRWNESFSHPLRERDHIVEVRVYDKNRTADEFMGSSTISLKNLELYKTYEMELRLDDPKSKENDMGVILVDVCLMFRDATIKRSPNQAAPSQRPAEMHKNQLKNQMWTGVLGITLVEGQDLPQYGQGDIYVRFRLGDQKYKSKNLCIQANPQWREQFDFNQFGDNQEPLQVEVFSKRGRKGEESWGMFEIDLLRLPLNERQLYTHVLNPGKGRLVFLVTLRSCWGVSISDVETAPLEKPDERDAVLEKFSLKNSHKSMGEIGFLQVKVIKANDLPATDLNGKTNPLCVVELGNGKLETHTVYKTLNPEWGKAFTFPIKDIHDAVVLTVLDENGDKAPNFLGKVAIPLLTVQNGQQISLFLKKEDLGSVTKGTITLVLDIIYNQVRAGIRTFQPKETKLTEEDLKFSKKVLARNIYRVRKISTAVLYTLQYIKSCFQWESTQRSLIAFLWQAVQGFSGYAGRKRCSVYKESTWQPSSLVIFLVTVWHWELFMLPLFLLLLIGWHYFQLTAGKASSNQDLVNMSMGDDEEEDEKESGKKGLMDKIHMVQEVVLVVQNVLEELANIGERIKNIFNWSVPFLSCLACLVLFVATALLYLIPLRYIVLIWGVNKFTKKLRNPYTIDNNEILDFLKRVPSDVQKVQYSALRAPTSQSQPRKKSSNYWLLSLPSVCSRAAPLLHSPQAIEYVTSAMGLGAQGHCAP